METDHEIHDLIRFLQNPTPYHVVKTIITHLEEEGFRPLVDLVEEVGKNDYKSGGGYYFASEGTLIAFRLPLLSAKEWGELTALPLRIWGAHTDSPTLKVKPRPVVHRHQHIQIGVEVYGGAILNTWVDRPLAVAGRIFTAEKGDAQPQSHLIDSSDPEMLLVIPNAAIHLNRNINKGFVLSPDTHLLPLWGVTGVATESSSQKTHEVEGNYKDWLIRLGEKCGIEGNILSHDLFLYDPQPPILLGQDQGFLNSSRLDNLAMVHAGLRGFLRSGKSPHRSHPSSPQVGALAFFNHEEIGSMTHEGAASGLLLKVIETFYRGLQGIAPNLDRYSWGLPDPVHKNQGSFLISADMAHGFHPNYESWYEDHHRPLLNRGPVIKYNVGFRYTSSGASAARIKYLLEHVEPHLAVQEYLHRADIPCGSTIGPLVSGRLAIPAVDIGNPLWAMHSTRETAGVKDHLMMIELAERFFKL